MTPAPANSEPHDRDVPPVDRIELRRLALPLVEPMRAGHGTTSVRELTVVGLRSGAVWGWGECAALPEPSYTPEWAAGAFEVLSRWLSADHDPTTALTARWHQATLDPETRSPESGANPMALAALEMAVLDLRLTVAERTLADWIGACHTSVPAGATLGLMPAPQAVARAEQLARAGYRRIKVKTEPGSDVEVMSALTRAATRFDRDISWQIDGNGVYGPSDRDRLLELAELGVSVLEQPYPAVRPDLAADLIRALSQRGLDTVVMADEAAVDAPTIAHLISSGAANAITVKPSRLGGLAAAVAVLELCRRLGTPVAAGGMIESGLGRHALAAVAARPECSIIGDLSPARRWLSHDPWPDLDTVAPSPHNVAEGRGDDRGLRLRVPTGPGVAPPPDPDILERHTEAVIVR
jgi:O-succinylbenzoate synthase